MEIYNLIGIPSLLKWICESNFIWFATNYRGHSVIDPVLGLYYSMRLVRMMYSIMNRHCLIDKKFDVITLYKSSYASRSPQVGRLFNHWV